MKKYDLCIIGGGPAGYAAAMRAVDLGKQVALIEKDKVGGAGIYSGALTSKTLWEISSKMHLSKKGLLANSTVYDFIHFKDVKKLVEEAVFERKYQLKCHIQLLENEANNRCFEYIRGKASFVTEHQVKVKKNGKEKLVEADHFIIATGSTPRELPQFDIDHQNILSSDDVMNLVEFPKSMVIVGAGVIGSEFATIFSNIGKTKVNIIDRGDRILPFEDEDVSQFITNSFEKNGVRVHHSAKLCRMETVAGGVEYEIENPDGTKEVIQVEKALLSVGRVPNIGSLKLEEIGVKISERGFIEENDTQTSVPHIYAVGDVTNHMALVNVAELEGRRAVEKMFNEPSSRPLTYKNISTIMFLNPEVAAVGMNEQQAQEKGLNYKCVKLDYSCIARAIAMRQPEGFIKILVSDDEEMKVLGMRVVGEHASSSIQAVALLISMNKGIHELVDLIHPHPSIIEGIQECLRMLLHKSIFKSEVFGDRMKFYRYKDGEIIHL